MTWMQAAVVTLYASSAILPIVGLFGLYRQATRTLRRLSPGQADWKNPDTSRWMVTDFFGVLREDVVERPHQIRADFILIGGGVLCGAAASIWALFPLP